ncbi:MAG: hypothetical protein K0R13_1685 [Propionibacteriaceae bacterium]|jgi:hypothetical protein|nr:hypothetical protein [Propionibacteriaceae bacterium]
MSRQSLPRWISPATDNTSGKRTTPGRSNSPLRLETVGAEAIVRDRRVGRLSCCLDERAEHDTSSKSD